MPSSPRNFTKFIKKTNSFFSILNRSILLFQQKVELSGAPYPLCPFDYRKSPDIPDEDDAIAAQSSATSTSSDACIHLPEREKSFERRPRLSTVDSVDETFDPSHRNASSMTLSLGSDSRTEEEAPCRAGAGSGPREMGPLRQDSPRPSTNHYENWFHLNFDKGRTTFVATLTAQIETPRAHRAHAFFEPFDTPIKEGVKIRAQSAPPLLNSRLDESNEIETAIAPI